MPITLNGTTGITTTEIGGATLVTASETIEANNNDTTLPTSAAVDAHIPAKLNATGSAPIYACRAWVNFNGTGTVAIRASGNVSSITDNGAGDYTINFTTAMPDANYAVFISTSSDIDRPIPATTTLLASSVRIFIENSVNAAVDPSTVTAAIFR